ncbi:MAG TPA: zf-HC2 domain-containing protein [Gemmatimonadaceae bacterium]
MQHPDEGTIHAWLDGALTADEAVGVEAHVKQCAQCQAAVAEARGFIAASSRILTALDNAPRGVIPVTQPKRRAAPWVWRVAATILVVAAGTLVVVRRTGVNQSLSANAPFQAVQRTNDSSRNPESAPSTIVLSPASPASRVAPLNQRTQSPKDFRAVPRASSPMAANEAAEAGAVRSGLRTDRQQNNKIAAVAENARIAQPSATAPSPAPAMAPTLSAAAPQRFGGGMGKTATGAASAADMAIAAEQPGVRPVGNRRAIGQKITLYEVAPGDTVELAEPTQLQLESVVVTGMSTMRTTTGQENVPAASRAAAKVMAPSADTSALPATSVAGVNTISWTDSAGRLIKLSGRHTTSELAQIRQRIEQSRAAARADSLKKNR